MIVPMVCTNASAAHGHGDKGVCLSCTSCLIYSDDQGDTWQFGGVGPPGSRESIVAQVKSTGTDAKLYMNARNFGPVCASPAP